MAQYEKVFTKPYEDGYVDLPNQTTPITAETLNDKDAAIEHIENFLDGHEFPTALADLSDDETHRLVTDTEIAEWNNKIDSTAVEEQTTTTGQFTTKTGGKLESGIVAFEPVQSGSGDPSPDNVRPITGHSSVEVTISDAEDTVIEDVTVALGGTYYGGSLDVVSGVLTVTKKYYDMGSLTWGKYTDSSNRVAFYTQSLTDITEENEEGAPPDFIMSCYKGVNSITRTNFMNNGADFTAVHIKTNKTIFIKDSTYTSEIDFATAVTGQQIVYELATPLVIQLTPQQINTLIGENIIDVPMTGQSLTSAVYRELFAWSDVEDVVELRLPISAIGTDESNNDTASQAYSQGDYFYKNGIAKAKTSIASGATFTLGTNYEIKTLAEILKALES